MKASETESNARRPRSNANADSVKLNHAGRFTPVMDSRNRRVPGLSQRNGRFYGQLWVERANGTKAARRFPLTVDGRPVETITEAKEAMEILRHQRREEKLPTDGRKPTFAETAAAYLESGDTNQKKPRTRKEEGYAIDRLKSVFGAVRIDKVTPALAAAYKDARLKGKGPAATRGKPAGPVAVNHDLIVLRNVLKYAVECEHIRDVPAIKLIKDMPEPRRRTLISDADFNRLVDACMVPSMKNGRQLADFLKFLAFTGAREQEALAVGWGSVDFDRETVSIGTGDTSKNRETRLVDFNPALAALLADMKTRRAPDSSWLFPSPQRGAKDIHARRLRESLKLARSAAGLPHVGFHHLRVLFISRCVMAGIDYLTIAGWVGHKDGGVLIGKTYGRLRDEHKKAMAAKLNLVPDR